MESLEEIVSHSLKDISDGKSKNFVFETISEKVSTMNDFLLQLISLYHQLNYTGPPQLNVSAPISTELASQIVDELTCEGEAPLSSVKSVELLWLAQVVNELWQPMQTSLILQRHVYTMFCIYLHQDLIKKERSSRLKADYTKCLKEARTVLDSEEISDRLRFNFCIQSGFLAQLYFDYQEAETLLKKCKSILGWECEFSGALGRRTKFQQEDKSQLFLKIIPNDRKSGVLSTAEIDTSLHTRPKNVSLECDILLSNTSFSSGDAVVPTTLTSLDHILLLTLGDFHRSTHPRDTITDEECLTFVQTVLIGSDSSNHNAGCWSALTDALFKRSVWEKSSSRRIQRALQQLEELSNQFQELEPKVGVRNSLFMFSRMPAIWDIQLEQAKLLLSLGASKAALDIFLRWERWNDVIACYVTLGQREQAELLIRRRLEEKETTELLCALGDVTQDLTHYERAWTFSKERSSRAARSIAIIHMFTTKDMERAMDFFEKSLGVNPLQISTWFTMGCCCLQAKEYLRAENAFRRCLQLEPDNFEAWNNCASALILRGEKQTAFTILRESIKCNYENWKVWDNLLSLSVDVGEFEESLRAFNRLLDLKQRSCDSRVLAVLVRAVNESLLDARGAPASCLRAPLQELFQRITETVTDDGEVWRLYAELLMGQKSPSMDTRHRSMQFLQRAQRCWTQKPGWERAVDDARGVLEKTLQVARQQLTSVDNDSEDRAVLAGIRLMLRGVHSQVKKAHTDAITEEVHPELVDIMADVTSLLDEIISRQSSHQTKITL